MNLPVQAPLLPVVLLPVLPAVITPPLSLRRRLVRRKIRVSLATSIAATTWMSLLLFMLLTIGNNNHHEHHNFSNSFCSHNDDVRARDDAGLHSSFDLRIMTSPISVVSAFQVRQQQPHHRIIRTHTSRQHHSTTTQLLGWFAAASSSSSSSSSSNTAANDTNQKDRPSPQNTLQSSPSQQQQQQQQQERRQRRRPKRNNYNVPPRKQPSILWDRYPIAEIGERIGAGSYGAVHYVYVTVDDDDDDDDEVDNAYDTYDYITDDDDDDDDVEEEEEEDYSNTRSSSGSSNGRRQRRLLLIGKRPWTVQELQYQYEQSADDTVIDTNQVRQLKETAKRCQYYYTVEQHCFTKLMTTTTTSAAAAAVSSVEQYVPQYLGTGLDQEQQHEWMLFEPLYAPPPLLTLDDTTNDVDDDDDNLVTSNEQRIAFSLQEIMEIDRMNWELQQLQQQQPLETTNGGGTNGFDTAGTTATIQTLPPVPNMNQQQHHLYCTSQALLGSQKDHTLTATLDVIMEQLLQIMVYIHSYSIVHRDVKPGNILITSGSTKMSSFPTYDNNIDIFDDETEQDATASSSRLVLIDFGSAGDTSTAGLLKENIGLDMNRVAISPIYAAPEIFLDNVGGGGGSKYVTNFDCFSVALLYCQLLFQYLDERTESGFHQQMANLNVPWDLDSWLQSSIQAKVRPVGLADALQVLSERPGLWKLLQDMLNPNPTERLSSSDALKRWNKIRTNALTISTTTTDRDELDPELFDGPYMLGVLESLETCEIPTIRPLHFVTSFDRSSSLGLYLAEADGVDVSSMDEMVQEQWQRATADAESGEVFVQDIVPGGQADMMGIFAIGDRLQGVGELPLASGGFERATELILDQPKFSEYVTLQFDRKSVLVTDIPTDQGDALEPKNDTPMIKKVDQGAWSVKGRRQIQEDAFVLHEVLDTRDKSVILAGVFDGHLGSAAADFCRDDLPVAFAAAMNVGTADDIDNNNESSNATSSPSTVQSFLELAWNECCESYRSMCEITDAECIAEYDPKEGLLQAKTGSETAVAGTTAMVFAFDPLSNQLAILNCGNSRGIVVNANNELLLQTLDHGPDVEIERLTEMGNPPKCDIARWTIAVNNYDYSVARSLEGYLATSKGIISDADISVMTTQPGMTMLAATDGLWDIIDTAEVMKVIAQLRKVKSSASDIAKALCSLAYEKGSSDNISVVALCLE